MVSASERASNHEVPFFSAVDAVPDIRPFEARRFARAPQDEVVSYDPISLLIEQRLDILVGLVHRFLRLLIADQDALDPSK